MQFPLPASPVEWKEAKAPRKIAVPLRLTAGNAADVPELWVLRENAVEQLDVLVRDSDERLTQRLMFAVATEPEGTQTVILRTRPSKLAPPSLTLEKAVAYKPFWKLPNLFIPLGRRLHPTLRRDAVRRLLANDPDQVVWLAPDEKTGFTPESVPDGAFRPLEDWVDYIIESEQKPLSAWIEATRFDFDQFICTETGGPKTKPDKGDREPRERDVENGADTKAVHQPKSAAKTKSSAKASAPTEFLAAPEEVKKPSEWKLRRAELEKQFHEIEGGLDAPERRNLWVQLAVASAGIPEEAEAAISWLNAMWNTDPIPAEWLGAWARSELGSSSLAIEPGDFDRALAQHSVGQKEARSVVASFLWLAAQNPVPSWLKARFPAVQAYLEKYEGSLPIRAAWLAGYRLAQLSGGGHSGPGPRSRSPSQSPPDRGAEPRKGLAEFPALRGPQGLGADARRSRAGARSPCRGPQMEHAPPAKPALHRPALRLRARQAPGNHDGQAAGGGGAESPGSTDPFHLAGTQVLRGLRQRLDGTVALQGVQVPHRSGPLGRDAQFCRSRRTSSTSSRRSRPRGEAAAPTTRTSARSISSIGSDTPPRFWSRRERFTPTPS